MAPSKRRRVESTADSVSSSTPVPIFKLNDDILGDIFSMNADMDQDAEGADPALVTLRYSSQVCSNWRQLAIGMSMLWARVLDFQHLWQKKAGWRREVIRRAGETAPLRIKACYSLDTTPKMQYVERLLSKHWNRVHTLDLQFGQYFRPARDPWPRLLGRPAPNLQVFKLGWTVHPSHLKLASSSFLLFANDAPSLQSLSLLVGQMTLNSTALRTPKLRNLTLTLSTPLLDLLVTLSCLPYLESLEVIGQGQKVPDRNINAENLPQVHLPRLTSIRLGSIPCCAAGHFHLLAHMIVGKGCALEFSDNILEIADNLEVERYFSSLATYSRYCTHLNTATNLSIVLQDYTLRVSVRHSSSDKFVFDVLLGGSFSFSTTISAFINSFPTLRFDQIQRLTLFLGTGRAFQLNPDIKKFLRALASVEYLATDWRTLDNIAIIQSNSPTTIMPGLRTLHLDKLYPVLEQSCVAGFLRSRIRQGAPVETLSVKAVREAELDLTFLKEIGGLTVQIIYDGEVL